MQKLSAIGSRRGDAVFIASRAAGLTIKQAAKQAGISERTAARRLTDPAFHVLIEDARSELRDQVIGLLSRLGVSAASTLGALLSAETPPAVRLGAARALLELAPKWREAEELEARIAALESRLEAGHEYPNQTRRTA